MNIILDLAVVAVLAITVFIGYKKGFIKSLMGLASGILALIIAFVFSPTLAALIDDNFIKPAVVSVVEEQIVSVIPDNSDMDPESLLNDAPAELTEFLSGIGVDVSQWKTYLPEQAPGDGEGPLSLNSVSQALASPLSRMIASVLAFAVIYIAALIILKIVTAMLDGLFSLPLLKIPNKILGAVIGGITGIITCFALCSVVNLLLPYLSESGNPFFANVTADKTLVFRFFSGFDAVKDVLGAVIQK